VSWQYAGRPDETGIIVDNTDAGFTVLSGTWTSDTISTAWPVPGGTYLYRSAAPGGTAQVQWQTTVPVSDYYEIHVWIPNLICCTQVQYIVDSPDDPGATSQTVNISQSAVHGDDGGWGLIGRPAYFVAGTTATVRLSNNSTCGTVVVADAVRFRRASPSAANHLFWQHCNMADPAHRDWLICNGNNAPIGLEEGNYAWMAPGIPDWAAYARKQIMYVVTQYDGSSPSRPRLDGVHFDHIRTPNNGSFPTQHWSYDPVSLARSGSSEANPAGLAWADWMRDQTNRFVQDIYAEILELRPDLRVSAAPLGLYADNRYPPEYPDPCVLTYGYSCAYQDTQNWLSRGAMDFIIPIIYWADGGSDPDFGEVAPDWVTNRAGRHVVAGQAAFKLEFTLAAMSNQVSVMRTLGCHGTCPFSYATFKYWTQYVAAGGPF